jgi:chaperonin GroEL
MSKIIELGPEARKKLVKGIDQIADAVVSTLGPNGRNVVISKPGESPQSTKDGVTVAKKHFIRRPNRRVRGSNVKTSSY